MKPSMHPDNLRSARATANGAARAHTCTTSGRGRGLVVWWPLIACLAGAWQPAAPRQPAPITFTGAAGERVGRWHGPTDREAPVALIVCERDASSRVAAVVPALWAALAEHGIRSLTLDPMPTV